MQLNKNQISKINELKSIIEEKSDQMDVLNDEKMYINEEKS